MVRLDCRRCGGHVIAEHMGEDSGWIETLCSCGAVLRKEVFGNQPSTDPEDELPTCECGALLELIEYGNTQAWRCSSRCRSRVVS